MVSSNVAEEDKSCLGYAFSHFGELEEVKKMMEKAWTVNERGKETLLERWKFILDTYQEQPHLVDPHLANILDNLVKMIRDHKDEQQLHITCKLLYHLTKVRGYKIVVRHLPHEIEDLEFVVSLLQKQNVKDTETWETRFVLLLWLSIIVIIPFKMSRFDSGTKEPLADRILSLCKEHLTTPDKSRDAASFLASKFLSRPDARDYALPNFIDWALVAATSENSRESDISGGLMSLAAVVKQSKREDILQYAPTVLSQLVKAKFKDHYYTNIRKLNLKLIQRLGMVFLKSKVASWRYQRGSRSLTIKLNLKSEGEEITTKGGEEDVDEEDYEIPEEIEEVIDELLNGLKDKETTVRWTAAKGIGRVTGRLPSDLADEVVGSLLELFSPRETDSAWHGACLSVAELGRRGLLLPNRLENVVQFITKALVYDERRSNFSVGSHIRDAACYVCWAFARAYEPAVLAPYVEILASSLLIVTVFDREVNCRRAASAAFQENVGRQGTFPHGIEILTTADYFAVGQRSNAYLNISKYIAQFGEYSKPLISHLLDMKVGHWDPSVRDLASKGLNRLTQCDVDFVLSVGIPKLLKMVHSTDLFSSNGATLATGQIVMACSVIADERGCSLKDLLGAETLTKVQDLIDDLIRGNKLRGLGGELMRQAAADFIENCSVAKLPLSFSVLNTWKTVLHDNLSDADLRVQAAAVLAIQAFVAQYYFKKGKVDVSARDELLEFYFTMLRAHEAQRKGFCLAIGTLPAIFMQDKKEEIISNLIRCARITEGTEKWAESRRDALKALSSVATKLVANISDEELHYIYDCFLISLEDYTVDRRGDIGAWVREAALSGIEMLTLELLDKDESRIPTSIIGQTMPCLAQQCVEKIDRTRGHAGRIFHSLLHAQSPQGNKIPGVKSRLDLETIFPKECGVKWSVESETFPLFVKLLKLREYSERILLGLIVSVGGLTERLVKSSSSTLFHELDQMNSAEIKKFCGNILKIFNDFQKVDRVTLPMLKFLDQVFTSERLNSILQDPSSEFSLSLFTSCKTEIVKCGDPNKLMASSEIFCQLLQAENLTTTRKCLVQIAIFLCHRFPRVRKYTADKFYEALLTFADREIIPDENLDSVMNLLSETNWIDGQVDDLKETRRTICELANVPVPTVVKKPA